MSVSVEKIITALPSSYKLNCIAGKNGMNNLAEWANLVEDEDFSSSYYLITNEIVFTSCMRNTYDGFLLDFVKNLRKYDCAALVVKVGIYIDKIPQDVIDFCNEIKLPLYTMPKTSSILQVTHDIAHQLIWDEKRPCSVNDTIKNIIFEGAEVHEVMNELESYNFSVDSIYCPVIIELGEQVNENSAVYKSIELHCAKAAESIGDQYTYFLYKNKYFVMVFVDYTEKMLKDFVSQFNLSSGFQALDNYVCVGSNKENLYMLSQNFKRAMSLTNIAKRHSERVIYYDDLDILKLFAEVNNVGILKEYYTETLGVLEEYDKNNGTSLSAVLETYLESNCNLLFVAEKYFLHRNTVSNQLIKINKITNIDPTNIDGRVKFAIAFYVKQFLDI